MKQVKLTRDTDVLGQEKPATTAADTTKSRRMTWYVIGLLAIAVAIILLARS